MENPESEKYTRTEWIERYLLGELPEKELLQFNQKLETDTAFRQEVFVQQRIMEQTRGVGRDEMRSELKAMHRQLGFDKTQNRQLPFTFLAIAASVVLLLTFAFILYFYNVRQTQDTTPVISRNQATQPMLATRASIRFQVKGAGPNMGFSGTDSDSTITILLYPGTSPAAYQFDDTLRIYGDLNSNRLTLLYNQPKEEYTLFLDSLSYPLQRYRPKQNLQETK